MVTAAIITSFKAADFSWKYWLALWGGSY